MVEKKYIQKKKKKTTPQHFCVAEDCMLLEGGVLYGFSGKGTVAGSLRVESEVQNSIITHKTLTHSLYML